MTPCRWCSNLDLMKLTPDRLAVQVYMCCRCLSTHEVDRRLRFGDEPDAGYVREQAEEWDLYLKTKEPLR